MFERKVDQVDDRHIGYFFKMITDKLKVQADADLKQYGLTLTQSRVLAFLNEKGGQATQKEIEDFLECSHPTVVGVISRMERGGFVITWFDADDKRNKIVKLTEKAHSIGEAMETAIDQHDEKILRSLSNEQIDELEKTLRIIYRNLE